MGLDVNPNGVGGKCPFLRKIVDPEHEFRGDRYQIVIFGSLLWTQMLGLTFV